MRTWAYPATFREEGVDDWVATFADLPEVVTGAASLEVARRQAADALEEGVLAYLADGRTVPAPRTARDGEELVLLDPVTASRAALAQAMDDQKVSNVELGRRLGRSEGAVRRLVSGAGSVKLDTVLEALRALGGRAALATF